METGLDGNDVIRNMEQRIEVMIKWLGSSGLIVNQDKTEVHLFHKANYALINITINNVTIRSKHSINILGVQFDSKLNFEGNKRICSFFRK